jgi:hypothetical protein
VKLANEVLNSLDNSKVEEAVKIGIYTVFYDGEGLVISVPGSKSVMMDKSEVEKLKKAIK